MEKEHRLLREHTMGKGDEGRTIVEVLDHSRGKAYVFVRDFFCSEITQNVSFFCYVARRKESGDVW